MRYQDKLNEITARTGIDFARYRDPALVAKLGNMLTIQFYALKAVAIPILILLLIFGGLAAYSVMTSKVLAGIAIGVIGIVPSIGLGILIGMVLLMSTIKNDVQSIFALSLDTVCTILRDITTGIQNKANSATDLQSNLPKPSDLLQGVTFGVILPSLQQIIVSKFKLLRTPLEYLFNTTIQAAVNTALELIDTKAGDVLSRHAGKLTAVTEKVSCISNETAEKANQYLSSSITRIEEVQQVIDAKIDTAGSKIIAPVKFVMVVALMATAVLVAAYIKFFL